MNNRKFAAILGVYGKPSDRFMAGGYKSRAPDIFERIQMAARGGLVHGVELIQGEGDDINQSNKREVRAALADAGLAICAVNPNLWGEPQWYKGTLGAADRAIRRQAIERVKIAIDLAAELGEAAVGLWPGQDGYDYLFEVDYQRLYEDWVSAVQELADYNPAVRIGLEYKPYEPRTHSAIDTAPKTLLMLRDINRPNVGLNFDVGHAFVAHENLGEVTALSMRDRKLFHIHMNDNYADWDWDLNFASVHLLDFIEMVYWLMRTGYDGWYSVDIFAYRLDAAASVDENLAWLDALMTFVEETGLEKFDSFLKAGDPIEVSRFFRKNLMK